MTTTNGSRGAQNERPLDPSPRLVGGLVRLGVGPLAGAVLVVAALLGTSIPSALAAIGGQPGAPVGGQAPAPAGGSVTISGSITGWPACSGRALFRPGSTLCLTYTVASTFPASVSVSGLSVSGVSAPAGCSAADFDLSATTFAGPLRVPARGAASAPGLPIAMVDAPRNQDACKGATFTFTYAATVTGGTK